MVVSDMTLHADWVVAGPLLESEQEIGWVTSQVLKVRWLEGVVAPQELTGPDGDWLSGILGVVEIQCLPRDHPIHHLVCMMMMVLLLLLLLLLLGPGWGHQVGSEKLQ